MDFKGKARFWLQNMSRKLENICVEVGGGFCSTGPMDLLENQIQTAQQTFRNLHSEFLKDVIPLITSQFSADMDRDVSLDENDIFTAHGEGSKIDIEGEQKDRNYGEVISSSCRASDELCVETPLQQCEETNLLSQIDEPLVDTLLQEIEDNTPKARPSNLPTDVLKMVIPGTEMNLREEKTSPPEALRLVSPAPPSVATGGVISNANDDQFAFPISMSQESEDTVTGRRPGKVPREVLKVVIPGIGENLHWEEINPVEARIFDSPAPPSMAIGGRVSKASDDHSAYRTTPLPQEFEDFFSVEEVDAYHISKFPAALTSSSGDSVSNGRRSDSTSAEEAMDGRNVEPAGMETTKPSDDELERSFFNVNTTKKSNSSSLKAKYVSDRLHLKKRDRGEADLEAKVAGKQEHEPQTVSFEDIINAEADHRANKEETAATMIRPSLAAASEVVETSDEDDSSDSDWEII